MSKKKNEENHTQSKYSTMTKHKGNCDPLYKQLGFDHPGKSYEHWPMIVLENQSLFRTLKFKQINQGDQIQLLEFKLKKSVNHIEKTEKDKKYDLDTQQRIIKIMEYESCRCIHHYRRT